MKKNKILIAAIMIISMILTSFSAMAVDNEVELIGIEGVVFDSSKYVEFNNDEPIKGYLPQMLEKLGDDYPIHISIWFKCDEPSDTDDLGNKIFINLNQELSKTLPKGVTVTKVNKYAPIVDAIAVKAQILEIAQMDSVSDICEADVYHKLISESPTNATGLKWDTWEEFISDISYTNLMAVTTYLKGDVNGDGKITSSDARLCLRASVKLEKLIEPQMLSADVDGDTSVTSADARSILRMSSKLEGSKIINIETDLLSSMNVGFVIGPIEKTQGNWQYKADEGAFDVIEKTIEHTLDNGDTEELIFYVFTSKKAGTLAVNFALSEGEQILDRFDVNVVAK